MTTDGARDTLDSILTHVLQVHGINLAPQPKRLTFPDGFRWRYFGRLKLARNVRAYCYSITRNDNGKYLSWIYQPKVGKECWVAVRICEHGKRKDAKARADRLSQRRLADDARD